MWKRNRVLGKLHYQRKFCKNKILGVGETRGNDGQNIDLCLQCAEKFINWLENEVTENER